MKAPNGLVLGDKSFFLINDMIQSKTFCTFHSIHFFPQKPFNFISGESWGNGNGFVGGNCGHLQQNFILGNFP